VKFFDILNVLKNMAAKEGYAPAAWVEQTKQVIKTGIVFVSEDSWVKKREELSLRSLEGTSGKIRKLIKQTGIDKIKPKVDSK